MGNGFFGKILWVDLSKESFEEENIPDKTIQQFLGGYGLGCKLIYENMAAKEDALGSDSIFGFFPGLLTGTAAPFSGRYMVAGKSPLTGTWGDANGGGTVAPEIKKCGYDGILIKGMASSPKYVSIIDGNKEILDASDIWGSDIVEAEKKLMEKHGKFIKTVGIGQAGEKLSLISGIANDKGRIAARSGIGAIMGSKKLKMLVLKGKQKVSFSNKTRFMDLVKEYNKKGKAEDPGLVGKILIKMVPKMAKTLRRTGMGMNMPTPVSTLRMLYHNLGTTSSNTLSSETGDTPIMNWSGIGMYNFPYKISKDLSATKIRKYKIRDYGCFTCPIQCGAILRVPELDLEETHLPEYETCASFGGMVGNHDLVSVFELNDICNRAAIDTISTGATVAFAIECYQEGILTKEDTDGIELKWGDSKGIVALTKKIINREGIGDILADGCRIASQKIGKGSEKYVMASLGQEIAMHNPRNFNSLGLTYAFDPTPGRHTAASVDFIDVGPIDKFMSGLKLPKGWKKKDAPRFKAQAKITAFQQVVNSLGLCYFSTLMGKYPLRELVEALTGWNIYMEEVVETGKRIQSLRQAFTLREGIDIANNELPGRVVGDPPDERGPNKGKTVDYKDFYKGYCREMGWNPDNGYPLKETLKDLDLEFVIKDLY